MSERPLLSVNDLRIRIGNKDVVRDVHYDLQRGETLGIVGASGSGKTLATLSLMGLLPAKLAKVTNGSARFVTKAGDEGDLYQLDEADLQRIRGSEIAMIFQEPMTALNPVYTCGKQVSEVIRQHRQVSKGQVREQVVELFRKVRLPDPENMFDRYPHQVSGGQKQRVMIAMAMSCQPRILIADEPTTALDVTVQKEILHLLKGLQSEHQMGMLFITHDLGVVREVADRLLVMLQGEVVEEGATEVILSDPKHPYTKGLIACRPSLTEHPKRLITVQEVMSGSADPLTREFTSPQERTVQTAERMQQQPLLSVRSLNKFFGKDPSFFSPNEKKYHALDSIELDVYTGETLGLVGGSGSGKTTLGRSILQLITPDSGNVSYRGKELTLLSADEMRRMRRKVQIIFQDPYSSLNPRKTIGGAMLEAMRVHGLGSNDKACRERIEALLERVGLEATHFGRYPHEFSGGQRQRVVIARTLVVEPELVICDESVSALDVSVQAQVLNLLNDLKEEHGLTYIFISHDLAVVKYMSDRIVVLDKGKIAEVATAEELYTSPKAEATKELIGAIPGE